MSSTSLWNQSRLGDLADIAIGGTPSRNISSYWADNDGFPWVAISDLQKRIIFETKEKISSTGVKNSNVKLVPKETVLMSFKLTLGRVAFAGCDLYTNEAIASFSCSRKLDSKYLYYVLPSVVRDAATDTAIKGATLNKSSLAALLIPYPTLSTQQKIATILTSIDTAIEKTEALIEKYQQIKSGLMHDLFTRGVLPSGQLRPTREQAPDLYQETKIGWIPKEWGVTGLRERSRLGTNFIRTGPFGSALKGEHWVTAGHPVITIGALGEGEFIESELLFVGKRDARRLVDFQLKPGDVVFSRVADVGRSVVIGDQQAGWIMSSNLMRIAVNEKELLPELVQLSLAYDYRLKSQIKSKVNSGGRDVANSEVLNQLRFIFPSINEQQQIVDKFNVIRQLIQNEQQKRAKLSHQKLGLMQDLLTGKVPVTVLENADQEEAHA